MKMKIKQILSDFVGLIKPLTKEEIESGATHSWTEIIFILTVMTFLFVILTLSKDKLS